MSDASPFQRPATCLVRAVPDAFTRALRSRPVELSVAVAREQHAAYVAALRETGAQVVLLPADEAAPDCCFIEDTAVLLARSALITRPGAASREREVGPVMLALAASLPVVAMEPPATLDGGDVLRAGRILFVGLSSRSNAAGAAALRTRAAREDLAVVTVPVQDGLHLKSACSLAAADLLVHHDSGLDPRPFVEAGLRVCPVQEPAGANVLALGPTVLVSADAPRTADLLEARGITVRRVCVTEFHRADGALTCLSIRVPPSSGWVT